MNEEYFGDCGLGLLEYVMEIPWAEMGRVTMDMIQAVSGIGVVVIGLTALTASGGALGGAAAALLAGNAVNLSGIAGTLATFLCGLGNVTMGTADFMQGAADLIRALQNDPEHAGHMIIDKLQLFQDHPWAYALLETAMTMGASYGKHLIQSGKMPVVDQKATGIWEKANSGLLAESGSNTNGEAHNVVNYAKYKEVLKTTEAANPLVESLRTTGELPQEYVTKAEAMAKGWRPGKALDNYIPGGQIGGDEFLNTTGILPKAKGRIWYEADVGLCNTISRAKQPGTRLVYSNDGLMYVTYDHYETVHAIGTWK